MNSQFKYMDHLINLSAFGLIIIGFFFVYSAAYDKAEGMSKLFYQRQILWAIVGLVFFALIFSWDYRRLLRVSYLLYLLGVFFLALVLIIGHKKMGAQRWLSFGGFIFQPSEFSKITLILGLTAYLSKIDPSYFKFRHFLGALIMMGIPMLFILKQPDLGTALIYLPIFIVMLFTANVPLRYLVIFILSGLSVSPLFWFVLKEYQRNRLLVFIDPNRDPLGAGYNLIQSKIAVGSGGFWGKGWLQGTQNQLHFLPERHTDFIFSVIGEEFGFFGSLIILLLFFFLVAGALNIADNAQDRAGKIMAAGIAAFFISHVFINIGMTIGIMPITGLPLPFVSYGGTSLITMLGALALLQNIYSRRYYF